MLNYIKKILNPRPSLFDLCVGGFLYLPWLKNDHDKAIFLVFYSIFLIILSLQMKPKRDYKSLPLMLLTLWSLIGIFIHSFVIYSKSVTYQYLNFYIMLEGFLYVFFGVLFLITVIRYSTNIRFIYLLLPLMILPLYTGLVRVGSTTPVAALGVSIVIYLFLVKRWIWGLATTAMGIVGAVWQWSWISMKFACRPMVWGQMITNVSYSPVRRLDGDMIDAGVQLTPFLEKFFTAHIPNFASVKPWLASVFGSGFLEVIGGKYVWIDLDLYGWIYKHNDFLNLGLCLGPIAIVLVVWAIVQSLKKIGIQPALILFMAVILTCFFQLTMYMPDKAGICLMIIALSIWSGLKRREENEENCNRI